MEPPLSTTVSYEMPIMTGTTTESIHSTNTPTAEANEEANTADPTSYDENQFPENSTEWHSSVTAPTTDKPDPISNLLEKFSRDNFIYQECGQRNPNGVVEHTINQDVRAEYGEIPWMVALLELPDYRYCCNGALINKTAILTTAHCITICGGNVSQIVVRVGEWDMSSTVELILPRQDIGVKKIYVHDDYKKSSLINNIALLVLNASVEYQATVQPVCLPEAQYELKSHENMIATGWGAMVEANATSKQILKVLHLNRVEMSICKRELKTEVNRDFELHESFVCANINHKDKERPCKGDAGAPVVVEIPRMVNRYYLHGLVSWGYGCNQNRTTYTVLTHVGHFRNWIDGILQPKAKKNSKKSNGKLKGNNRGYCVKSENCSVPTYRLRSNRCPTYEEICCPKSTFPGAPTTDKPDPISNLLEEFSRDNFIYQECGQRNPYGVVEHTINQDVRAEYGEIPWMVALLELPDYRYCCNGALIDKNAILTTAHCITIFGGNVSQIVVRVGEWDMSSTVELILPRQDIGVKKIYVHDDYKKSSLINNIALLVLNASVEYQATVQPVCLPEAQYELKSHENMIATGWGAMVEANATSKQILKVLHLNRVEMSICKRELKTEVNRDFELHESFVCANINHKDKERPCKGDAGAPVVVEIPRMVNRYYLHGLVSWGYGCNQNRTTYTVLTHVGHFRNWIDGILQPKAKKNSKKSNGKLKGTTGNTSCGEKQICVFHDKCKDDKIITDGANIIQGRIGGCIQHGYVCCGLPEYEPDSDEQPDDPDWSPQCGQRTNVSERTDQESGTNRFEFPWSVTLFGEVKFGGRRKKQFLCGGILIDDYTVVTAARCVHQKNRTVLRVELGRWDLNDERESRTQEVAVEDVIVHEEYVSSSHVNNIALLILEGGVNIGRAVNRVCLDVSRHDPPYRTMTMDDYSLCYVVGWSHIPSDNKHNRPLKLSSTFASAQECMESVRRATRSLEFLLPKENFCPSYLDNTVPCERAPGSGLVCESNLGGRDQFFLAGIASYSVRNCNQYQVHDVFLKILDYVDWIDYHVAKQNRQPSYYKPNPSVE
ncbi:transmembrane protease serine 9-like [Anopheles moucheti]|uniref:transmembrane protease serine 9-like n=1 Tax=Anopheles moucheti TaxID=186751 RepID=UPI0022F0B42F|nr:transmembrane protease serine 9-like [Anopheles moucheti]